MFNNQKVEDFLADDYKHLTDHCCACSLEFIRNLDKSIIEKTKQIPIKNEDIYEAMKSIAQLMEMCSHYNEEQTRRNLNIPCNQEVTQAQLAMNFLAWHANADFRRRWAQMVFEMADDENIDFAIQVFGNEKPGLAEKFFAYRMSGLIHTLGERHQKLFTCPTLRKKEETGEGINGNPRDTQLIFILIPRD